MIIVPVDNLIEGMVLAKDVTTTSATDYRTLLMRGTFLTAEMIGMLRKKGIKSVNIIGDDHAAVCAAGRLQWPVLLPAARNRQGGSAVLLQPWIFQRYQRQAP